MDKWHNVSDWQFRPIRKGLDENSIKNLAEKVPEFVAGFLQVANCWLQKLANVDRDTVKSLRSVEDK